MNKLIQTVTLTLAAAAVAIPARADTLVPLHAVTAPVVVHNGTAAALNTQPIPPGRPLNMVRAILGTTPLAQTLNAHALNTQPIPPGHGASTTRKAAGHGGKHHGGHAITRHWDVTKNSKS